MAQEKSNPSSPTPQSFEESVAQLEQIVTAMPNCEYREYLAKEVVAEAKRLTK